LVRKLGGPQSKFRNGGEDRNLFLDRNTTKFSQILMSNGEGDNDFKL
jgi:hypothetical protein